MITNIKRSNNFQYLSSLLTINKKQRQFHAYCIGIPKSGTHSLANILNHHLSQHEPEWQNMLDIIAQEHLKRVKYNHNYYLITDNFYKSFFRKRDRYLQLELESSHLLAPFVKIIAELFPEAKFILTIRDCYSWLDSIINDELNFESSRLRFYWKKAYDYYFYAEKYSYNSCENILRDNNLYPISAYLNYWKQHNEGIINLLPEDRLLIVKTNKIKTEANKIYDFLGCKNNPNKFQGYHSYKCKKKHNILSKIPKKYLQEKVNLEAGGLMQKYFPDADINQIYD